MAWGKAITAMGRRLDRGFTKISAVLRPRPVTAAVELEKPERLEDHAETAAEASVLQAASS